MVSLQLVSITKQMCGLRGFARTEFSLSLSSFIQQITNISRLVGHCHGTLQAMAITAHLLEATAPESFLHGPLQVGGRLGRRRGLRKRELEGEREIWEGGRNERLCV